MSAPLPFPISLVNVVMILPHGRVEPNSAQPSESTRQSLVWESTSDGIFLNDSVDTYSASARVGGIAGANSFGCTLAIGCSLTGLVFYDDDRFQQRSSSL